MTKNTHRSKPRLRGRHAAQPLGGVAAAGFAAQLVDGSLGMGYGLTSSTVLVASGISPVTASASVHVISESTRTYVGGGGGVDINEQ